MATRLILQTDKRSNNTFGHALSDTTASLLVPGGTYASVLVPGGVGMALITVGGSIAYIAVNGLPVLPTSASFVFQTGTQVNNGASKMFTVNSGQSITVITVDAANVQVSFYENETVN